MIRNFLMKKMMERQMKNVPKEQQERIMNAVQTNPELFKKINKEIKAEIKKGRSQMVASMEVMKKHQKELQQAMGQ